MPPRTRRALGLTSAEGAPCLAPEVQLFYKAKEPRPKDEEDLSTVLPLLAADRRHWLADAISLAYEQYGQCRQYRPYDACSPYGPQGPPPLARAAAPGGRPVNRRR